MLIDSVRLAFGLARKDLRLYFRDRTGMALGFILPIALIAVFAAVFGSMGGDDGGLPKQAMRVVDEDGSNASRGLVQTLRDSNLADVIVEDRDHKALTRDTAFQEVKTGRSPLAVVIQPGFGKDIDAGKAPPIEVIRDPGKTMEFQIASQALFTALMKSSGNKLGRAMAMNGIRSWRDAFGGGSAETGVLERLATAFFDRFEQTIEKTARERASRPDSRPEVPAANGDRLAGFSGMGSMIGIKETLAGPENETPAEMRHLFMLSQSVSGTAIMMLLFGLTACGTTILQEKEGGTLRRLLLTPAPRGAIIAGKFLFTFAVGLLQLVVMFAFGAIAFRLPVLSHLPGLAVVSMATGAACTPFGVFIATIGRTQKQIEGISTLLILLMSAIGGSWFPRFIMPKWLQFAGNFTVNGWAMDAYNAVLAHDQPVSAVLVEVGVLVAVAAVLTTAAIVLFQRRFAASDRA